MQVSSIQGGPMLTSASETAPPMPAKEAAPPSPPQAEPADSFLRAALDHAVERLNQMIAVRSTQLRFVVDNHRKRLIVSMIDVDTNAILRQIPSEEALRIADYIDATQGLGLRSQA